MDAPAITRSRRPFLAPIWVTALLVLAALGILIGLYESASITTVVVVGGEQSSPGSIADPPLAPEGEARARQLAQMLGDASASVPGHIEAIYISATRAITALAAPLAARLGLQPITLGDDSMEAAAARVLGEHRGGTALLIVRTKSVPLLIHALSGVTVSQPQTEPPLFVVTVPSYGHATLLRMSY